MKKSPEYVNGVIAAKEVGLLGDKISRLCESGAEDAFRAVTESGFGKGAEVASVYDYEKLLFADERDLDEFIREYAPSDAEKAYLLSPRDFHNAKAIVKARFSKSEVGDMLAPDGLICADDIKKYIEEGDIKPLGEKLASAVEEAWALSESEEGEGASVSGAEIGAIFEKSLYAHMCAACKRNFTLKKLLIKKSDMTDILTALRSKTPEYASNNYISAGKLKPEQLEKLFSDDAESIARALDGTGYEEFLKSCLEDRENGTLARAELTVDNLEIDFLAERKYELKRSQPFLYYVLRRRAENSNLRILFACLIAGVPEGDIKRRLRAV